MSTILRAGLLGNVAALGLFEHLAESTWGWLGDSRKLGLGFSEDTISDLTMLEITRSGLNGVDVKRVSKRQERLVGIELLDLTRDRQQNAVALTKEYRCVFEEHIKRPVGPHGTFRPDVGDGMYSKTRPALILATTRFRN